MPRNTHVRPLKQPILDDHVQASINSVAAYDAETGHYGRLRYVGCPTRERAKEIVQGLHRAAKRLDVSMAAAVTAEEDGTFTVEFSAVDKAHARAYVLAKYGKDRSKWPYSPVKGDANYGA